MNLLAKKMDARVKPTHDDRDRCAVTWRKAIPKRVADQLAQTLEAAGVEGFRVEDAAELRPVLQKAFAHDGPALVDVVTARMELVMPPKIEAEHALGFSLYAAKAIINGRGTEVVELARTNLFR